MSPKAVGDRAKRGGVLCLPWDSFRVSNDCLKIEQMFESRQDGAVENPKLWRKILHGRRVKRRRDAFALARRSFGWFCHSPHELGLPRRSARSVPIRQVSVAHQANVHGMVRTGAGTGYRPKDETMRAVGLFDHGGPEVLQVVELPEVHAGPGQVRIRVHAATVNPTDVMVRNGTRAEQQKADPPPYVPGMEAAGIVDEVGSGVPDRLKLGDAVLAIVVPKGSHGAYREQIVLDARSVVRAPAGKTHAEAATLPMNGLTARLSLDLLKLSWVRSSQ